MSGQSIAALLPVDHAVIVVRDLIAASTLMSELGFSVTAPARHSAQMGTWNFCVMFAGFYLEFLAIEKETPLNVGWQRSLAQGGGLRGLALQMQNVPQTMQVLDGLGIAHTQALSFTREDAISGENLAFSVVRLKQDNPTDIQILYCKHLTPHLMWGRGQYEHANSVAAVRALGMHTEAPHIVQKILQKLAGGAPHSTKNPTVYASKSKSFISLSFSTLHHAHKFIEKSRKLGMIARNVKGGVMLAGVSSCPLQFHIALSALL